MSVGGFPGRLPMPCDPTGRYRSSKRFYANLGWASRTSDSRPEVETPATPPLALCERVALRDAGDAS